MDGNLWAGPDLIPGDPNIQNNNGKHFERFLARNSQLSVANALDQCEGVITRYRKTINGEEKSVLDFFVFCDKVKAYISKMVIDEEKKHSLTNFYPAQQRKKVKASDHNPLIADLYLKTCVRRAERVELFNFKNKECQDVFYELTNTTETFTGCFKNNLPFEDQAKNWKSTLDSFFHQAFRKVRISQKKIKETEISKLIEKRSKIKYRMSKNNEEVDVELEEIEHKIANECAKENRDKVIENLQEFGGNQGSVNTNMWNMKKRIFPKLNPIKPTGKNDAKGNIITSPEGLKCLYLETYQQRLRHRTMLEDLKEIKELKETLFKLRINLAKKTRSKPWDMEQLDKVPVSLKITKARQPLGMVNDLFNI